MVSQDFRAELQELAESIEREGTVTLKKIGSSVASQLQHFRERKGLSQSDLAKLLGTGQSRISQMEDPGYGKLSLASLAKAAVCLDCELVVELRSVSSPNSEAGEVSQFARSVVETLKQSSAELASAIEAKPKLKPVETEQFSGSTTFPNDNVSKPAGSSRNQKWVV